jgi:hypothetical protein
MEGLQAVTRIGIVILQNPRCRPISRTLPALGPRTISWQGPFVLWLRAPSELKPSPPPPRQRFRELSISVHEPLRPSVTVVEN